MARINDQCTLILRFNELLTNSLLGNTVEVSSRCIAASFKQVMRKWSKECVSFQPHRDAADAFFSGTNEGGWTRRVTGETNPRSISQPKSARKMRFRRAENLLRQAIAGAPRHVAPARSLC
jgi:hypothetical protein